MVGYVVLGLAGLLLRSCALDLLVGSWCGVWVVGFAIWRCFILMGLCVINLWVGVGLILVDCGLGGLFGCGLSCCGGLRFGVCLLLVWYAFGLLVGARLVGVG